VTVLANFHRPTTGALVHYELHGRRSIKGVRSHVKRVREDLGEVRAVDLKSKHLTEYQIARRRAEAAGGTIKSGVVATSASRPALP
jgi:hypothetical protein